MGYCIIENGVIVNIVEASAEFAAQNGWVENRGWGIGWVSDGQGGFAPAPAPSPSVPSAVTMRQARLALLGAGLLDDVDAAINGLPSPQKEAARIEWEYSQEVQRHNGFVSVLAPLLGLSEEQADALFIQAGGL